MQPRFSLLGTAWPAVAGVAHDVGDGMNAREEEQVGRRDPAQHEPGRFDAIVRASERHAAILPLHLPHGCAEIGDAGADASG